MRNRPLLLVSFYYHHDLAIGDLLELKYDFVFSSFVGWTDEKEESGPAPSPAEDEEEERVAQRSLKKRRVLLEDDDDSDE